MIRKRIAEKYGKYMYMIATAVLLFALSGCAGQESNGKSLREHGMDVVKIMEEMVKNTDYGSLMGNNAEAVEDIRAGLAAGDYSTPSAVYVMELPSIENILSLTGESRSMDGFSEALKRQITERSASTLVNLLNSQSGYASLAAASVYSAKKTFVDETKAGSILYLYTFEKGCPIAVAFTAGEGNAMTATGTFLILEDFDAQAVQELIELMKNLGLAGEMRQLP